MNLPDFERSRSKSVMLPSVAPIILTGASTCAINRFSSSVSSVSVINRDKVASLKHGIGIFMPSCLISCPCSVKNGAKQSTIKRETEFMRLIMDRKTENVKYFYDPVAVPQVQTKKEKGSP